MKKSFLFVSVFFIAAIIGLSYFGYPVIKNRYFQGGDDLKKENVIENKELQKSDGSDKNISSNAEVSSTNDNVSDNLEVSDGDGIEEDNAMLDITKNDCDRGCKDYIEAEELKYCREVCGLNKVQDTNRSNCDSFSGLEKDYCLKNQAIDQNDLKICEKVSDNKIRKTCQNRIAEELLDKSEISD